MDLPVPVLPDPQRPLGPREPQIAAAAGRRDRRNHTPGPWINLLDAILGDLKQMLAVEGGPRMRAHVNRAHDLPTRRVERVQPVTAGKPDMLTIERDPSHAFDTRKGSILVKDFRR